MLCRRCLHTLAINAMQQQRCALAQHSSATPPCVFSTQHTLSSSSSSSARPQPPPVRTHKRHVTPLERAAAIGLEALKPQGGANTTRQQQQQQQQRLAPPPALGGAAGPLVPAAAAAAAANQQAGAPLQQQQQQQQQDPQQRVKKRVGVLQKLPVIPPPEEMAASALKRSMRVAPGAGIRNEAEKERSRAAKQLDTHMKELSVPLTRWLKAFPAMPAGLHPFEAALLDLTVGAATYGSVLGKVDTLRKALQEVGKSSANRAAKAANKKAASAAAEEGSAALAAVFAKGSKALEDLRKVSRSLRTLPYVEPTLPTLALVGAPNVGKSSLVRVLSSGVPEVCNYPFTTRSIKMGHFYIQAARHQVMDTPGLLQRPDDFRNKMELLTLAALQHLPSSVLFVADLTEECGTSVADQWAIRCELRARFPAKPWVDVLSKADLLQDVWRQAEALQQQQAADAAGCAGPAEVQSAAGFAAALPAAVRVSSLTEEGLVHLQQRIAAMLQTQAAVQQLADAAAADAAAAAADAAAAAAQQTLLPPQQ